MIKLIIFDFDDTLVDSKRVSYENHIVTIKKLKLKPVSEKKYFSLYGMPHQELVKTLYSKLDYKQYELISKKSFDEKKFKPFSTTNSTLSYLKKKYKLAIITTKEKWKVKKIVKNFKLEKYFDLIQTPQDYKFIKPDPKTFNYILHHFKLKKEEVAYVGDLQSDYDAAKNAEIFFVGINSEPKEGILWCDSIEKLKNIF